MTVYPRTPVYWPRMKIRGRRNRAKAAVRRRFVTVIPFARVTRTDLTSTGVSTTFAALAAPEPGSLRLSFTQVQDGFGRNVGGKKVDVR